MTRLDFLKRAEWALAVFLTAAALFLLVIRATHAGALWRDECGTVQLAMMPKVSDIMDYFDHQTFPPLLPLIVRGYIHLFGDSDVALRGFGLAAGITYVGATWWAARVAGQGVPLMAIALFGLSPLFLRWGTTVGGYGFGAVLIVIAFAATVKLLQKRTPLLTLLVLLAALVSQQFVISNLILVLTIVLSALVIALGHRKSKTAGILALIAVCATLLGTIYLRIFANDEWRILFQQASHARDLWGEFTQAYGQGWLITWIARAGFLIISVTGAWVSFRKPGDDNRVVILRFALLVMLLSPLAYFGALLIVGYRTHWWHYLLLLALLPVLMDTIVIDGSAPTGNKHQHCRGKTYRAGNTPRPHRRCPVATRYLLQPLLSRQDDMDDVARNNRSPNTSLRLTVSKNDFAQSYWRLLGSNPAYSRIWESDLVRR